MKRLRRIDNGEGFYRAATPKDGRYKTTESYVGARFLHRRCRPKGPALHRSANLDNATDGGRSGADGGAEGGGDGMGEALDVGIVFGFDHYASELLGAGIAEDDAAVFAKGSVGFREGADDFGN